MEERGVPLFPSLKLMFILPDSFCAATKIIPGTASVHTQERL